MSNELSKPMACAPLLLSPHKKTEDLFWTPEFVGGKAANLLALAKLHVPVPAWFCVTTVAFKEILSPQQEKIDSLLQNTVTTTAQDAVLLEKQIALLISQATFPPEIEHELASLPQDTLWAVRSSANAEDSASHSFAGQFETFLFVPTEKLAAKILECWASAYNARVLQYLIAQKQQHKIKVAVVIQEMVHSEKAGVMFSENPQGTGARFDSCMVITAGYGLGEGIVSDTVETDTFFVHKETLEIQESVLQEKQHKVEFDRKSGHGTVLKNIPPELAHGPCLSQAEVSRLAEWGVKIEKAYGFPQDIEWAIDTKGEILFTQSRPITTLAKATLRKYIFDNSNIVESFPGVNTPLTLSVIRPIYTSVFSDTLRKLGISKRDIEDNRFLFEHLLAYNKGRVYYNITHWYEMMRFFPFTEGYIKVWEKMLGVEDSDKDSHLERNYYKRLWRFIKGFILFCFYFLFLDFFLKRVEKRLCKAFETFWEEEKKREMFGPGFTDPQHFEKGWNTLYQRISSGWDLTLLNDAYAFIFSGLTQYLIKVFKLDKGDSQKLFNELMCGVENMDSVGPLDSLRNLVKHKKDFGEDEEYQRLFRKHLHSFGDRGASELKLETVTMREAPEILVELVVRHQEMRENSEIKSGEGKKSVALLKMNPLKALLFHYVLKKAQRSILYREKFRLHRSRLYGILRRFIRRMGAELCERKIIAELEDIFFLELREIFALASGNSFDTEVEKLIKDRKEKFEYYKSIEAAPKYYFSNFTYSPIVTISDSASLLKGQGCSQGLITGEAVVVVDITQFDEEKTPIKGKILVAPMTDPGWVFVMTLASGLIVEKGSILSHTAIIGRELGIPTIVGVKHATQRIKTGDKITMNATTGEIYHG